MVTGPCTHGCFDVVESDPHSHSDTGGVIKVQGPHCEACGQPMDCIGEGEIVGGRVVEWGAGP